MNSLHIPQHGYRVWFRKNEEGQSWAALSYSPRESYSEAESLVDFLEGEWGPLYEYSIHSCGSRPVGMCVPYV